MDTQYLNVIYLKCSKELCMQTVLQFLIFYFHTNNNISDGGLYICRARNEKMQNQAVVDITVLQGKVPIQCQDQPKLANCALIVRAKYCARNENFARICCQSCVNSGQIAGPPA